MRRFVPFVLAAFAAILAVGGHPPECSGQSPAGPTLGVVWDPPATFSELRTEFADIAEHGVQAARLGLVFDPNIYVLSDMFGVRLFQEIDLSFAAATRISERADELAARIDSALTIAAGMSADVTLGLGSWNDTSDPRACEVLSTLAGVARRAAPRVRIYYVTPFIEADACADAVDFVLLDGRSVEDPKSLVDRWQDAHSTPVGIAALGSRVRSTAGPGYLVPESKEGQARKLESALAALVDDQQLVAVFVDRWAERDPERLRFADIEGDYGLLDPDGSYRPAADVVKGFYTATQRVFAFSAGEARSEDFSWLNLIAFIVTILFGLTYYGSLSMRSLLRRYFRSHSFYLEKVADGREATTGISLFLLFCLSLAASTVGTTLVLQLHSTNLWLALNEWLPVWSSWGLKAGVRFPAFLILAFGGLFAVVTILWAVGLAAVTRGANSLRFGQTMLLAVLPRWPVAVIGLLALVVLNWHVDAPGPIIVAVTAAWLTVVTFYTGRMFSDYLRLLGITALWTVPVLMLALGLVVSTAWLVVATRDLMPELMFLWNLATKT